MTLNLTLLTEEAIYQSGDFRLVDADTRKLVTDTSMKVISVSCPEWHVFITYTGVGRWKSKDTAEWVVDWLTGVTGFPDPLIERLRVEGTEWLAGIERETKRRYAHTFVVAGFTEGAATAWVISNFEDVRDLNGSVDETLAVSLRQFARQPVLLVTGQKPAVARPMRRRLQRLVNKRPDPSRIRRVMAEINEEAARSPKSRGTVSEGCAVLSVRSDGQGAAQFSDDHAIELRQILGGVPAPSIAKLEKLLGLKVGQIKGATWASSGPRKPFVPCRPEIDEADGSHRLHEIRHPDLDTLQAHDVSAGGVVLGQGAKSESPAVTIPWLSNGADEPKVASFLGSPGGLNEQQVVALTAQRTDGLVNAARWHDEQVEELERFKGDTSGGNAVSGDGTVVGWVGLDPNDRGQAAQRPAAWLAGGELVVLEDFECDWGNAVAAIDDCVLVVGYRSREVRSIRWYPAEGRYELVGKPGVYPMDLTADGTVLGKANDANGESIAAIAPPGSGWERLGTDAGWYATAINDAGDVVGATRIEGFERPWIRLASGEVSWLPYLRHHWCRPTAVSSSGLVAGGGQADHGSHALLWTPK